MVFVSHVIDYALGRNQHDDISTPECFRVYAYLRLILMLNAGTVTLQPDLREVPQKKR